MTVNADSAGAAGRGLAGAWMARVTFTSNAPPALPAGAEVLLQGFGDDGLLSTYVAAIQTTGYGVWRATNNEGGFAYTFQELVLNPDGSVRGYVVVTQAGAVSADGSSYSSSGQGQLHDLDGVPLAPPSGSTTQATRIQLPND